MIDVTVFTGGACKASLDKAIEFRALAVREVDGSVKCGSSPEGHQANLGRDANSTQEQNLAACGKLIVVG